MLSPILPSEIITYCKLYDLTIDIFEKVLALDKVMVPILNNAMKPPKKKGK